MSDIMRPMPFGQLMTWALEEYRTYGSLFGVSKLPRHGGGKALSIFGEKLEAPFGPAAGPNTQLAQNIVAAYAAGSRFFELKTVQVLDGAELSRCVNKPCIAADDECYNCEWSTELTVEQAYEEYVKAWFACKLLARELSLGDPDGFVFNMSVGYDLAGIQSGKIDRYLEGMKDASGSDVWRTCRAWTLEHLELFQRVNRDDLAALSPCVSRSVTESTLHGCPPEEIERIASYLMTEKGLHTYVKCNPTLLGYEFARNTLDSLGYDYVQFDDHHFLGDLQREDAVPMLRRLSRLAGERGVEFGVKLTNTFPVDVAAGELPSEEMYLSGRPLYPLTVSLAAQLSREFQGKLRISYSGGADAFSVRALFDAGVWPVTMATTVLKPGGYERFAQIAALLPDTDAPWTGVDVSAVEALAEDALKGGRCRKSGKPSAARKLAEQVPLLDCFRAPCRDGCPIHQDIPAYLSLVEEGKYEEALRVITQRNPLPFLTGVLCSHRCQDKCMRGGYDEPVFIRAAKLKAARGGFEALLPQLKPAPPAAGKRVAVVGGGPAGLSAAYFLGRAGVRTTVFERRESLGGVVRHVIPAFRIEDGDIERDIALCRAMGAEFRLNCAVSSVQSLFDAGYTHVILATGAWRKGDAGLSYGEALDVLDFLERAKQNPEAVRLGEHVVVVGGGNTAMDAARGARRIPGVKDVTIVYRRTRRYMPADPEELELALADGVALRELLAPVGVRDGLLTCQVMTLGAPDASGRRSPVETGETVALPASTVITAVGAQVDAPFYRDNGLAVDRRGRAVVDPETLESSVPHVYVAGDGQKGPGTVVEAIAGAAKAAGAIAALDVERYVDRNRRAERYQALLAKRGELCGDCEGCEDSRCLGCATVCEACASVCPNRANVAVWVPGMEMRQILHIDGMCNECGNCATFCPYDSRPYRDKFTLFWREEDFENSENDGFLPLAGGGTRVRLGGAVGEYDVSDPGCGLFDGLRRTICAVYSQYRYLLG